MHAFRTAVTALLLGVWLMATADAQHCAARSGERAPLVVELYTSEGCSSCPPADRWLSSLEGRADVIALAFHVDYWDRLGWKDRFASPAWTARQYEVAARGAARFVYTPQVLLNGRDYRAWPGLPASRVAAPVGLSLVREDGDYVARVERGAAAPLRLAGYWAVTEDGHVSHVKSGENAGATLRHAAVVRELREVAEVGGAELRFRPAPASSQTPQTPQAARKVHFVVIDAASGTPLQALALDC